MSETVEEILERMKPDQPCKGVAAVALLYALGFDDFEVEAKWRKVAGRPYPRVHNLVLDSQEAKAEMRRRMVDEFAKEVGAP